MDCLFGACAGGKERASKKWRKSVQSLKYRLSTGDLKLARSATKAFSSAKPPQLSSNSFNNKKKLHQSQPHTDTQTHTYTHTHTHTHIQQTVTQRNSCEGCNMIAIFHVFFNVFFPINSLVNSYRLHRQFSRYGVTSFDAFH